MQLVDTAALMPHCCTICAGSQGPFLDTLVDRFEGRFYVCAPCGRRMANLTGALRPLRAELATERGHIKHLQARIDELEHEAAENAKAIALTLKHGAVTKGGSIVPRSRAPRKTAK